MRGILVKINGYGWWPNSFVSFQNGPSTPRRGALVGSLGSGAREVAVLYKVCVAPARSCDCALLVGSWSWCSGNSGTSRCLWVAKGCMVQVHLRDATFWLTHVELVPVGHTCATYTCMCIHACITPYLSLTHRST